MTIPLMALLQQSMAHSSVPFGLLDPQTQEFVFLNQPLQHVIERHRMNSASTPEECMIEMKPQIMLCVQSRSEQVHLWPSTGTRIVLVPLIDGETVIAIQCFAQEDSDAQVRHFEQTLHHLPVGIWMAKLDGEIYWVNRANPAYRPHVDHDTYYHTAEWFQDIHPDDLVTCASSFSKAAIKGKVEPFEFRMRVADGSMHWFYCDGGPVMNADGSVDRWAGISLDIQHVKEAEARHQQEIERLREEARAEAQRVQSINTELSRVQKMELVGELAGSVAHDFNNLLFVIDINTGLLCRATKESKALEYAQMIQRDVARAARTASELMTFSGRQPQLPQIYEVSTLLKDIEELLRRAVGAEVNFSMEIAGDLAPVEVDKTWFENALINLAVNARDAVAGKGQVRMAFRNCRLSRDGQMRDYVQIEVSDNGIGMSDETRQRIFEPFFTTKAPGKGTGLGLPMVANFVTQCGGFIDIQSALGHGTKVQLHLPHSTQTAQEPVEQPVQVVGGHENLLLIEDDLHVRNAVAQLLIDRGYVVSTAYTPEVALRYIRLGLRPDLILSDIRMPGRISAIELVRQLEAEGLLPPVLFMTGYAPEIAIMEGLVEGRFPIIHKPISGDALAVKVREVLAGSNPDHTAC